MSLLADLLSKIKSGPSYGDEGSPHLDVPPTLTDYRKIPPKVQRLNSRYIALSILALVMVAAGALLIAKFRPQAGSPTPPRAVQAPRAARDISPKPSPQPADQTPAAAAPETLPGATARITLGEPASSSGEEKPAPPTEAPPRSWQKVKRQPPLLRPAARRQEGVERHQAGTRHLPAPAAAPIAAREQVAGRQPAAPAPRTQRSGQVDTAARDSFLYAARGAEMESDWKSALAGYRKALETDPGNYRIMSNIAAMLNNLGLYQEATREAERALATKPDYVPALVNAAIAYSSTGDTVRARRLFASAKAIEPGNRSASLNLAVMYERAGDLDEALAAYRQLSVAGDAVAMAGMGRIYELKSRKTEAIRIYRQILAQPHTSPALKNEVKGRLIRLEE